MFTQSTSLNRSTGLPFFLSLGLALNLLACDSGNTLPDNTLPISQASPSPSPSVVPAPTQLTYSEYGPDYIKGIAVVSNLPSNQGGVITQYSISPSLPNGLNLDPITGIITGIPHAYSPASTYTVTGANAGGSTTAKLMISVNRQMGGAVPAPSGGAYLGVVDPNPLSTLEALIGRKVAVHVAYYAWSTAPTSPLANPIFPTAGMQDDLNNGRTSVITWHCGPKNPEIISGVYDSYIASAAQAIKAFGTDLLDTSGNKIYPNGKPVFIRWQWEMNLAPGANTQNCMDYSYSPDGGYIGAWRHIHDVFKQQGVTNVSWAWNPAGAPQDYEYKDSNPLDTSTYVPNQGDPGIFFPGADYVDYIAFDGYDKKDLYDFAEVFDNGQAYDPKNGKYSFFREFENYNRPFIVFETGECQGHQSQYLSSALTEMTQGKFPGLSGFTYFDSVGGYHGCGPTSQNWTWVLDTPSSQNGNDNGLGAYTDMGESPLFKAFYGP